MKSQLKEIEKENLIPHEELLEYAKRIEWIENDYVQKWEEVLNPPKEENIPSKKLMTEEKTLNPWENEMNNKKEESEYELLLGKELRNRKKGLRSILKSPEKELTDDSIIEQKLNQSKTKHDNLIDDLVPLAGAMKENALHIAETVKGSVKVI